MRVLPGSRLGLEERAELVAVGVVASLALGVQAQRRRTRRSLFAVEASAALVSLLMLAGVAYVLRFTNV